MVCINAIKDSITAETTMDCIFCLYSDPCAQFTWALLGMLILFIGLHVKKFDVSVGEIICLFNVIDRTNIA